MALKSNTQIVVHIFPYELDWFEWQSRQLNISSNYLSVDDKVIMDVTMDFNFIDWEKSKLPKELFVDKFNQIKSLYDWAEIKFDINENGTCRGCDDKRRNSIRSSTSDNILYLDTDLIFPVETLKYMIDASKMIEDEYYIVSPQTVRMWDTSWDIITNKKYMNMSADIQTYKNVNPFSILINNIENVELKSINTFKFGGGWFNLFSTKLLKLIDVPDSFGPYGVDDLYIMICCDILKKYNYSVKQYVLNNTVVTENNKYRQNPYINHIKIIDKQDEFRINAKNNLNKEIQNFINKITSKI